MTRSTKPVFFDPEQRRWPKLRLAILIIGIFLFSVISFLIISILINPVLPAFNLPNFSFLPRGGHSVPFSPTPLLKTKAEWALQQVKTRLEKEQEKTLAKFLEKARFNRSKEGRPLLLGYYVNWDDASFNSLKEHLDHLDVVIPEFLHLSGSDGNIRENDSSRQVLVSQYIRQRYPNLPIVPLINNWNGEVWEGEKVFQLVQDKNKRAHLINKIVDYLEKNNFQGINIDFENLPSQAQAGMLVWMSELYSVLHEKGLFVYLNVPAIDPTWELEKYAKVVDLLIVMAYDEHWSSGTPGPIASMGWFAQVLARCGEKIPPEKMIFSLANYAYDWGPHSPAQEKTFGEAVLTAKESKASITLDPDSLNPSFHYEDDDKALHSVWMLDAVSLFNQLATASALHPKGYALWRLGGEDPTVWNLLTYDGLLDANAAASLHEIRFSYALDYEGKGEILRVTAQPRAGERNLRYENGLIVEETFTAYPSPYVITRYGYVPKKIALTFDDGPDPEWTPAVLDALRDAGIQATFFIIGSNGQQYPEIIQRIVSEGHEIGNHTFTHPNVANLPVLHFQLELSATQRLLESVIGRQTRLFRAPYAVDSEPQNSGEIRPLEVATERGYLSVGMQIDPNDWQRPGTEEIVSRILEGAAKGEGNIVLLHDSGGDRTQTVEAIPKLAIALRERGFQTVTISGLLGRTRDEVMPPLRRKPWDIWVDHAAFSLLQLGISTVHWLFLAGVILGVGRLIFIGILAVLQRSTRKQPSYYCPSVAVILPAYNEAKVINQTIVSLLASDHPERFEIIVIDDGSTDGTLEKVRSTFSEEPRVQIYTKENGGKASALNEGISHTSAEVIVALDADTVFTRDTISQLVQHFSDPKVGAVAGNAKVGNRSNLLTRWQALEYITSQNLDRRAFEFLNCITVVPGAVGAWRRNLVIEAGGFSDITLAEDADLTLAIRKLGYIIRYEESAVALTEAPDTVRAFLRQRYRWMYGTMQAAWHHRDIFLRPKYGFLGGIALPNILIFQVLFPLISPLMDLVLIFSLFSAGLEWRQHPDQFSDDGLQHILFYYSLFVAVDFFAAVLAFMMEPKEDWSLLLWLFLQRFFYRQLMYYVAIQSTLASLKGIVVGWNKLDRKATVLPPAD